MGREKQMTRAKKVHEILVKKEGSHKPDRKRLEEKNRMAASSQNMTIMRATKIMRM